MTHDERIHELYDAFNRRDVDALLAAMTPDVRWPNGWEGGTLDGRGEVRAYWARQWAAIDPRVTPVAFDERPDGTVAVRVHQVVRQLDGAPVLDHHVLHVYRFDGDRVAEMTIEDEPVD